jgi:hypothetical protein
MQSGSLRFDYHVDNYAVGSIAPHKCVPECSRISPRNTDHRFLEYGVALALKAHHGVAFTFVDHAWWDSSVTGIRGINHI